MMEKLGCPQTHLGLKGMIQEVDEDQDGMMNFREVRDWLEFKTREGVEGLTHEAGQKLILPPPVKFGLKSYTLRPRFSIRK